MHNQKLSLSQLQHLEKTQIPFSNQRNNSQSVKQKEERDLQRIEKHLETKREQNILNEEKKERIMATIEYKQLRVIERNREKSEQIRKKNYS